MANPKLIVIAGCNGAGKSTLAPFLLRDAFGLNHFVNADVIAAGLSAFAPEKIALEAGRVMLKRLNDLAQKGENFAFETTLATRFYAAWIEKLKANGYQFNLLFLWLNSAELAVRRVEERVKLGGHFIEEAIIHRRYLRGLTNFFELYQPLADNWLVYDNSSVANASLIAKGGGLLPTTITDQKIWKKICETAKFK